MSMIKLSTRRLLFAAIVSIILAPFVGSNGFEARGQQGNSISGYVFGLDRQPMSDVFVELMDDLSRTQQRARTDPSGRFVFYGLPSGRFRIRVMPFGTDYEEQVQEIEIVDFLRGSGGSQARVGVTNEQRDIYLRLRNGATAGAASTVFAQTVPDAAKKLYASALTDLTNKKEKEAYESLKSALEVFPEYYAALELLGNEYVKHRYFEAAKVLLQIAVRVNSRGYKSWYGLAYSQYSLKEFEPAKESVEKAVDLSPNSPEAVFLSGSLLRLTKRYDEAEKRLIKAKNLASESIPEIHWELALLYGNNLKRYSDAARELKLFLKARPDSKDAEQIRKLIAQFEAKAGGS